MKILVLCYEYPPVGGGGGRIAASVAAGLAARGHEVKFLTGNVNPPHRLPPQECIDGVDIHRVSSPRKLPDTCAVHEMAFYVAGAVFAALPLCRTFRPDVIHAHFAVPTGAAAWVISKITKIPYVLTAHLGDVPGGVPEQTDRLFRWIKPFTNPIWNSAAAITAVSSFVARLAKKSYSREARIIPNGIVINHTQMPDMEKPVRFLFVGRISVQKNLRLALEALAQLGEEEWEAEVVGDGPLRVDAEQYVRTSGMAHRIRFHGWMPASDLQVLRRRCSVLLMPSLAEGLPMAAVEALADGLAIVGTDIPGLADVVEPERNGFLCPATPGDFAARLRLLITEEQLLQKFRLHSISKAESFDLQSVVSSYEQVLRTASAAKSLQS